MTDERCDSEQPTGWFTDPWGVRRHGVEQGPPGSTDFVPDRHGTCDASIDLGWLGTGGLRDQIAAALRQLDEEGGPPTAGGDRLEEADAVLAVRDREMEQLRGELAGAKATIDHMSTAMSWISGHDRQGLDHLEEAQQEAAERERAEAQVARVRQVVAERRTEIAEFEAEHPPTSWADAAANTCDRIDDALRVSSPPGFIRDGDTSDQQPKEQP